MAGPNKSFDSTTIEDILPKHPVLAWTDSGEALGYDKISTAISDGHREVWYLEDIQDGAIPIPTVTLDVGLTIKGVGSNPIITDENQDGTPIFDADTTDSAFDVTIENVRVDGDPNNSGPILNADYQANAEKGHRWSIRDCEFNNCGPFILLGGDEVTFENVSSIARNSVDVTINGTPITTGAGLVHQGQSTHIRGGDFGNYAGAGDYGARFVNMRKFDVIGPQFKHDDSGGTGVAMAAFDGCEDGAVISSTSGPQVGAGAPNDLEFHRGLASQNCRNLTVTNPSTVAGSILLSDINDSEFVRPTGTNTEFVTDSAFEIQVQEGSKVASVSGPTSQNVLIVSGGGSGETPQSGGTFELADGRFQMQEAGKGLILKTPDGTSKYEITVDNAGNLTTTQL